MTQENEELLASIDQFAMLMKQRIMQKDEQGMTDWKESSLEKTQYEIQTRIARMQQSLGQKNTDPTYVFIGIANWALIGYLNETKTKNNEQNPS